jgi:hypothetical protein
VSRITEKACTELYKEHSRTPLVVSLGTAGGIVLGSAVTGCGVEPTGVGVESKGATVRVLGDKDSSDGATGEKGAEGDFIADSPGCVAVASTGAMVLGDKDSGDCATGEKSAE